MSSKMTLNGKATAFEAGQTILEIARGQGIYIPSLCYHRKTGPLNRCRLCVVEVQGLRGLQTACSTVAAEDMVVTTDTAEIRAAQKFVLDLLLSDGQHNCLSCEANGACELQNAAYHCGLEVPAFTVAPYQPERDASSEMIVFDRHKCIRCGRCVEADNRVVVNEVLNFARRGHDSHVICDDDRPMGDSTCVQCGECVQICPVGALLDKKAIGKGRPWEMRQVATVCPYCGVGCQLTLHIHRERNEIVRITGVEGAPANDGMLCVKGRYGYEFVQSAERLTTPLIKDAHGQFQAATWAEALAYVAAALTRLKTAYGPDAIAGLSSAKATNEENFAFQKFMRREIGTNNVDHCARL